jgi:nitronate monooxygenase
MTLQQLLRIPLPIIQAPMAGVQGSALAVAVCNAGGLGSLPSDQQRRLLQRVEQGEDESGGRHEMTR